MINDFNKAQKSRSYENNLNIYGRKIPDELSSSSLSLIDLPTSSTINYDDNDNFTKINDNYALDKETTIINDSNSITKKFTQIQISILSELDQKIKDEIDAKLKHIDDDFDFNCKT